MPLKLTPNQQNQLLFTSTTAKLNKLTITSPKLVIVKLKTFSESTSLLNSSLNMSYCIETQVFVVSYYTFNNNTATDETYHQ